MNMHVYPLFASPLVTMRVKENIDELGEYVKKEPFGVGTQPGNKGSQASRDKRILEKYNNLNDLMLKYFYEFSRIHLRYDGLFKISTSWFTKVEKGQSSQFHFHKNSFYSGVLYFGKYDPKNEGSIQFANPIEQFSDYQIIPREYYIGNCNEYRAYPEKNILLLFPSYLSHRIDTYLGNKPRYSLAFNIIPVGQYGEGDSFYDTNWDRKI